MWGFQRASSPPGNRQELTDEELVRHWRADSGSRLARDSLNELFGRYHARVAAWCYRFTGDRSSAADLAQDVFLKAYRNLESFEGSARFSTWLYAIARNHCFNDMKSRGSRPEAGLDVLVAEPADRSMEDVLSVLVARESRDRANELMNKVLDETERKVMALHFQEGIQLDTITRLLRLSNTSGARAYVLSAKRKLSAAVQRLRNAGQL